MKNLFIFLVFFLASSSLFAQGYDKNRGRDSVEKEESIRFQFKSLAFGFGSFFDNEAITFSKDALYGAIQWHGIGLPIIEEGSSTGILLEGHVGQILGQEEFGYSMRVQDLRTVDYRIWSMTRVPISAIPFNIFKKGVVSRMYSGTDILLTEGGTDILLAEEGEIDYTKDFNVRLVFGGDLGVIGPGNMTFEIYSFQKNQPIAFAIFYGF